MKFLRNREKIDISRYLPKYLANDKDFDGTLYSETEEHKRVLDAISSLLTENFIKTAKNTLFLYGDFVGEDINGLSEERQKEVILAKYLGAQTSTIKSLEEKASMFAGQDVFIEEYNENYYFEIFTKAGIDNIAELSKIINLYKPAHLGFGYQVAQEISTNWFFSGVSVVSEKDIDLSKVKEITMPEGITYIGGRAIVYKEIYLGGVK